MTKLGTVTATHGNRRHVRKLRNTPGIHLDYVKSGAYFTKYVITDGEWNPANCDGKRVYDDDDGWIEVDK